MKDPDQCRWIPPLRKLWVGNKVKGANHKGQVDLDFRPTITEVNDLKVFPQQQQQLSQFYDLTDLRFAAGKN